MYLKVLVDNNTYIDKYYYGQPAVSYYIECDGHRLLFDTGYDDTLLKNSELMSIDLHHIDTIVLSHGHNDHSGGLKYLSQYMDTKTISLIMHPHCLNKKYDQGLYIGCPYHHDDIAKYYNVLLTRTAYRISEHLLFLGEIERNNNFEGLNPIGQQEMNAQLLDDYVLDDSALIYHDDKGLFIISGCSHSGICNIIEYSKKITGINYIYGVIGGFHLLMNNDNNQLVKTIDYLKQCRIKQLAPCHCVSLYAKHKMMESLLIDEVAVGYEINL